MKISTALAFVSTLVATLTLTPEIVVAEAYGDAFRIGDFSNGYQAPYSAVAGANGDVAILWASDGAHFISRYDGAGRPLQSRPLAVEADVYEVAVSGTGSFATVRFVSNGIGSDLFIKVYDRSGNQVVAEFMVNAPTADQRVHYGAKIAMNSRGQFAVVWQRWSASGSGSLATEVFARRYEANGVPVAPAALVRTASARVLGNDIGIDSRGNFVVIWNEVVGSGVSADLYGRRYAYYGAPIAPAFLINLGETQMPHIAMNSAGAFVVATYSRSSALKWNVQARRFSASAVALGLPVNVNVQQSDAPMCLDLDTSSDGGFVVTWQEATGSTTGPILARSFDVNGGAIDAPTKVSADNGGTREFGCPVLAVDPAGNSTIAWEQRESPVSPDAWDAFARRYTPANASVTPLVSGQTMTGLAGAPGSWSYFKIRVEPGQATLDVIMSGTIGDADLYLRRGALPTLTQWDGRPYLNGSNEGVRMLNFPPGDWYIGVNGYTSFSSVSLNARAY
ncbi:MAG TPA: PPC domain-containing protein, partial [Polyangiales bacterium]|nr:PPC domain-containing protein [Polyangiales bacterium]